MAETDSKHEGREKVFSIKSFDDGLNLEYAPNFQASSSLSRCQNMKYAYNMALDGTKRVILKARQGTRQLSYSALSGPVVACTYYNAQHQYIVATSTTLYYLVDGDDPVEIGTIYGTPTFTEFNGKLIVHDGQVTKAWDGTTFENLTCLYKQEVVGTGNNSDVDFSGTLDNPAVKAASVIFTFTDGTAKTITSSADGTLSGDVATHELIGTQADRDFSGASNWADVDLTSYDETDDLSIVGTPGKYCTLPEANAPRTAGKRYRLTFDATVTSGNFIIKSFDGVQTIGSVTTSGAQSFDWTETQAGGLRIVCGTGDPPPASAGDFDNFALTTNVIDYTTGVFSFRCSGAPDSSTSVYAQYENVDGAPHSKAGLVRASQLYLWGDPADPSRIWYSGTNDEDGWDTSSDGGYVDVDPKDGYDLIGALGFYDTLLLIKGNSLHRMDNFPGDTDFGVVPVQQDLGGVAYRTCLNDAEFISFLTSAGWVGMETSERYGDIQKTTDLSLKFTTKAVSCANAYAYSEYNQIDKQLWISLHDGVNYLPDVYVINLTTGGQLSLYRFAFGHSCFKYVAGKMLIGGSDGHLYELVNDDSTFLDNGVSYSSTTKFRTSYSDGDFPFHRKHNKKINVRAYGKGGLSANLVIYTDQVPKAQSTTALPFDAFTIDSYINPDLKLVDIYDMDYFISSKSTANVIPKKFNYQTVMFEVNTIYGSKGAEFYGIDNLAAIVGPDMEE